MMSLCSSALLLLLLPLHSAATADDSLETRFREQVRQLDPRKSKKERLAALKWIENHLKREEAARAVPALERCLKKDPDADVRGQAVQHLAMIAFYRKQPCPLVVVETMLDPDAGVRNLAGSCAWMFKTFSSGAVPVLLRCMKSDDPEDRNTAVTLLGRAGGKSEKTVQVVGEATRDKEYFVRHNARIALFSLSDKLEDIVPYCVRVQIELPASAPRPERTEEVKRDRDRRGLLLMASLMKLADLLESRPDECAKLLKALLQDRAASTRRATAFTLAEMVRVAREKNFAAETKLTPTPEDMFKPFVASVTVLRKQKVDAILKKLSDDDPDTGVRATARRALREFEAAQRPSRKSP